ncbi:MAG: HAD hydrolase-like protein [Rhodospirillales bacterium]|nr:HAD hydrolase-like protein [Rhodospirillales bacterium]MCW8952868.1 HAD hydrolase-like protein [Rhodospirillales bacterium]MCW8969760.1 HAD hydrolase-like protein [Rhodospirillales bacterium]MCW9001723.1 HAD hydrolase-like protein [Rhodospirillales bacterium]
MFLDFDGVILESVSVKTQAFADLYAPHGQDVVARVLDLHRRHGGISRLVKIRTAHKDFLGIDLSDDALAHLANDYARRVVNHVIACPWVPGAQDFLERHRGKTALFVVSGTPEKELRYIVEQRGMTRYFNGVYGSPMLKDRIINDVMAENGLHKNRAVMIGDAMTDYDAARKTGLRFIGRVAPGDRNPFPKGTEVVADLSNVGI